MSLRTTLITGATSGIGKETALALAKKGHAIYMLVRNTAKGEELRQEIITQTGNKDIFVIECDLSDLKSVAQAAANIKAKLFNIQVLINNAGGIFNEREVSKNGYEMTFALNHLGHFLLTMSLMPLLQKGQARIINVSSEAHKMGKPDFSDLQSTQNYSAMKVYGTAKLFNIYFAKSLAEKFKEKGILAFALHPGIVKTQFGTELSGFSKFLMTLASPFMITPEKGAETSIYLATEPRLDKFTGLYFKKKRVAKPAKIAENEEARNRLWQVSETLIEGY